MNLKSVGKNTKVMNDTYVMEANHPDGGYIQSMTLPDGRPKGVRKVLDERGLWPAN